MDGSASRDRPSPGRVHIVGAGLSGLSAALRLAKQGRPVALYEAASQAGGRCRSYVDAKLERSIDNGNHMLLAANTAALDFVAEIGARDTLTRPARAAFPFLDLASGESWTVEPSEGPIPWWIFSAARRIPGTAAADYLAAWKLAFAGADDTVADCLKDSGPLWERFWVPLTVAALNTHPREASARLLWLVVRESFAKGAAACRPFIAKEGLSETFVDPALAALRAQGGAVAFGRRLRALSFEADRVTALDFGEQQVPIAPGEAVVLALPPAGAADLLPGLQAPRDAAPPAGAGAADPGPGRRGHRLAVPARRRGEPDGQRRRRPGRAPRGRGRSAAVARHRQGPGAGPPGRAYDPHHQGKARHPGPNPGGPEAASGPAHPLDQPGAGRRLDRYRLPGNHRIGRALRRRRRRGAPKALISAA